MCNIAALQASSWLMVDPWEGLQSYQRTAVVLDHFDHEINDIGGGIPWDDDTTQPDSNEMRVDVRIMLLAGSDLINTMSEPGVWSDEDVSASQYPLI